MFKSYPETYLHYLVKPQKKPVQLTKETSARCSVTFEFVKSK